MVDLINGLHREGHLPDIPPPFPGPVLEHFLRRKCSRKLSRQFLEKFYKDSRTDEFPPAHRIWMVPVDPNNYINNWHSLCFQHPSTTNVQFQSWIDVFICPGNDASPCGKCYIHCIVRTDVYFIQIIRNGLALSNGLGHDSFAPRRSSRCKTVLSLARKNGPFI